MGWGKVNWALRPEEHCFLLEVGLYYASGVSGSDGRGSPDLHQSQMQEQFSRKDLITGVGGVDTGLGHL